MAEDPAAEPLDPDERKNIEADLVDLEGMRSVFEAQGMRGVVIACPECGSDHFYGWDLLRESLEHMLKTGEPRMHEPAFEPRAEDYVLWDYGKGYVDALTEAGLQDAGPVDLLSCSWCETPVEPHYSYCFKCGRSLAPLRLLKELVARGMDEREARALLVKAGFDPIP